MKYRLIFILLISIISIQASQSQQQNNLTESQREFYNFYWGNKLDDGGFVYPSNILYDLLTNEVIGTMDQEVIRYYYISEGSGGPKLSSEITVRGSRYNGISDQYYCFKFKTYQNAIRWLNGERFESSKLKKNEKKKKEESTNWANNNEYAKPNQLIDSKLFGVYLPDIKRLIEYVKSNKNEIYGLRADYLNNIKGNRIDSLGFTLNNLVSEFIYADTSKSLISNPEYKDEIFYKIYCYMFKGLHPIDSKRNSIGYNGFGQSRGILRYVYSKEVNLFIVIEQGEIMVFDPVFGPLYFKKSQSGFKFYDNQKENVKLTFNKNSGLFQYQPKGNYKNNLPTYFVSNGDAPKQDSIGLEYRLLQSELDFFRLTTYMEGPISTLPAYGYNNIKYFKINNLDIYIGSNLFEKDFIDTIDLPTTFQQRQLMYQAGRISQNQLFNSNVTLRDTKVRRGLSGEKEEVILNSYGYAITPFFEEIRQISNSFFRIKCKNKYGLLYVSPESIKENKMVLFKPIYDSLWGKIEDGNILLTVSILDKSQVKKEVYLIDKNGNSINNKILDSLSSVSVKKFNTIALGNQIWMLDNLNVSEFRNGEQILHAKTSEEWIDADKKGIPAWCYFNNDTSNGRLYGKLYNYYAVIDPRGLAPLGFHISKESEWKELFNFYGNDKVLMKIKSNSGWIENGNGNLPNGIALKPGGARNRSGIFGNGSEYSAPFEATGKDLIGKVVSFWATSSGRREASWFTIFYNDKEAVSIGNTFSFGNGRYIRCLKD